MRWTHTLPLRLRSLFRRNRVEQDLHDELQFHIDQLTSQHIARGMTPEEARRAALRETHGIEAVKDRCRDTRRTGWIEDAIRDVRYAGRTLGRNPTFAAVTILTLTIGIGANTAIFSLISAVRADALPYQEPDRLVELWGTSLGPGAQRSGASYPDYLEWRARSHTFVDVAAFDAQMITLVGRDDPERINAEFVSAPYFSLLGAAPQRGRTFLANEDLVSNPSAVVVLSDGLWRMHFGGDPTIVGQTIRLRGGPFSAYTVIGVMPADFRSVSRDPAELWLPFALWSDQKAMSDRGTRGFGALARLNPGTTLAAAQAEIDGVARQIQQRYPETNPERGVEVSPLDVEVFRVFRGILSVLMGAVALVFVIVCANVANLLIARTESRRGEIAIRMAVGAGRARLFRQFVTESCVLTAIGGVLGLTSAGVLARALIAQSPVTFPTFVEPTIDWRVALFTIVVSLVAGLLVSLSFGTLIARAGTHDVLKQTAKGARGRASRRRRQILVVAEMSLAVVLLTAAGLLVRSVQNLTALDPGFNADRLLTLHVSRQTTLPDARVEGTPSAGMVEGRVLLERILSVPGVQSASLSTDVPLDGNAAGNFFTVEDYPLPDALGRPRSYLHRVSADFFSTLQIPIVRGRAFVESDMRTVPTTVIVNERLVRRFWPGGDPIGKRIKLGSLTTDIPWMTIVGVVPEVMYRRLGQDDTDRDLYLPFPDRNAQVAIAIRARVPPSSLIEPVQAAIRAADPTIAVYGVAPMTQLMEAQRSLYRFLMWLMTLFATVALLLALIGIYGVMSYVIEERTHEIGIRMALGARRTAIVTSILSQSGILAGMGLAVGLLGAAAVGRLLPQVILVGVNPADPVTFTSVVVLFGTAAMLASGIAASRAAKIDPIVALRCE